MGEAQATSCYKVLKRKEKGFCSLMAQFYKFNNRELEQGAADGKRLRPAEGWQLNALRHFFDRVERLHSKKKPSRGWVRSLLQESLR